MKEVSTIISSARIVTEMSISTSVKAEVEVEPDDEDAEREVTLSGALEANFGFIVRVDLLPVGTTKGGYSPSDAEGVVGVDGLAVWFERP